MEHGLSRKIGWINWLGLSVELGLARAVVIMLDVVEYLLKYFRWELGSDSHVRRDAYACRLAELDLARVLQASSCHFSGVGHPDNSLVSHEGHVMNRGTECLR